MVERLGARLQFIRWLDPAARTALVLLILLGIFAARFAWQTPLLMEAERALHDLRVMVLAPRVDQDPRISLVVYTDETLRASGKRSPLDRKILADALRSIDAMRPKAIGIDILIDQPQPEDEYLLQVLRNMKTPVLLAYETDVSNPEQISVWQREYLEQFFRRTRPGPVRPASVRLVVDPDNVIRRWPAHPDGLPPLLPVAVAGGASSFADYQGAIDYKVEKDDEYPVFSKLPIDLLAGEIAPALHSQFAGRYVLIGGDITDLDDYETPMYRGDEQMTKGIEVQAQLLSQVLDGRKLFEIPSWLYWFAPLPLVAAGGATALFPARRRWRAVAVAAQILALIILPFAIHAAAKATFGLPAAGWIVGWFCGYRAVRIVQRTIRWEKGRVAQAALTRYLPEDVAADILSSPDSLNLQGERKMIFALFTDMEGFTSLCHSMETSEVAKLLNQYLETLSQIVLDHGGTIDKFVGDAVIAFWGAPIAKPDDGERATRAALALHAAGEQFRLRYSSEHGRRIGRTRVGLHYGEAIIGNFGGKGRIQYTALGDTMNLAARLEAANKQLGSSILISREAASYSSGVLFRPLAEIVVRGRSASVEVVEPANDMDAAQVQRLEALYDRFRNGHSGALDELRAWSMERPFDTALARLVERLSAAGAGKPAFLH